MKTVLVILMSVFLTSYVFAREPIKIPVKKEIRNYITKQNIDKKETQVAVVLDNIYILPATETIVIRLMEQYLDDTDKVLRSKNIGQVIYKNEVDNPETSQDESSTAYSDFLTSAGIDIEKIKEALK